MYTYISYLEYFAQLHPKQNPDRHLPSKSNMHHKRSHAKSHALNNVYLMFSLNISPQKI